MNTDEAIRRLRQRFGTPERLCQVLGLDGAAPTTPLDFLRSKMSPEDLDAYLNRLLIDANRRATEAEGEDERIGSLETGGLSSGLTPNAKTAMDTKLSTEHSFAKLHGTTHTPGIA